jgi:SOS-response transcriptional repressor LexA
MQDSFVRDITGCASGELYALQVKGDSMEPEFPDGVVIIIDPTGVLKDGSYVLAIQNDEYLFRQYRRKEGKHYLTILKDESETVEIPGSDVTNVIKGIIVQQSIPGKGRKGRKFYT